MRRTAIIALAALCLCSCGPAIRVPAPSKKTAIVAHRGFWLCEAASNSENSIASLEQAQKAHLWGSECDIHLTADGKVVVNHNRDFVRKGMSIAQHDYADFDGITLPNGEGLPLFKDYLLKAKSCPGTFLVVEIKDQKSDERNDALVGKMLSDIREAGMYDPALLGFISFDWHVCCELAKLCPGFCNQYLASELTRKKSPKEVKEAGINGIDYQYRVFYEHPEWVEEAHALGMTVNSWTVNREQDIRRMIGLGVDQITTNYPLLVREILSKNELVRGK